MSLRLKRKSSELWNFFTPITENLAICSMCKQKLSYKTSTSNLKKHLQKKHSTVKIPVNTRIQEKATVQEEMPEAQVTDTEILDTFDDHQPCNSNQSSSSDCSSNPPQTSLHLKSYQPSSSISTTTTLKQSILFAKKNIDRSKDKIDQKLLNLFIQDFQPFSIVQDKGFQEFVAELNPNYQLPGKSVISKTLIPSIYKECRIKTKELVDTGICFCITIDSWTSITMSYNAITAHFLDNNFNLISLLLDCCAVDMHNISEKYLALELQRITTEWDIKNKIIMTISDARNIECAIRNIGWKHIECIAHTINLTVKDELRHDNIQSIISKVKEVVTYFTRNNIANIQLMKYQENKGKTLPLKLILEVPTRWNSTFYMLQRFIDLEEAIRSTIMQIELETTITAQEWEIIKQLCEILKPFEDVTKALSGEKYCSGSLIIPLCNSLRKTLFKLSKKQQYSNNVNEMLKNLQLNFEQRLNFAENNDILSIATFLDPKFKHLGFSSLNIAHNVKQNIVNMIADKIAIKQGKREDAETKKYILDEDENLETSIWSDFDKSVAATNQPKETSTSRAIIEMQRYMEEELIPRQSNSFLWWQLHKQMLPHLSEIAQERLCVLGTSVPCDRLFSKAGQLLMERRNRLSDKTMQKLLFLNANSSYLS